jgi:hypothetical protein
VVSAALRYAGSAAVATAIQLALLLGPGLVLAALMHALSGFVSRRTGRILGAAAYLIFGWLGTAVHEAGHALFCLLFGHRITGVKLFDFAPRDGTRGHVSHTFDPANPWQLAEPLPQSGLLRSGGDWLVLARHVAGGAGGALAALIEPQRFLDWRAWVFLYLTFAVGSSISLSESDFKGALAGFVTLVILALIANLATFWSGDVLGTGVGWIVRWQVVGYAAMLFALAVNALVALVLLVIPGRASR